MKTAIIYFSLTGNTEKTAFEIARQLKEKNINISTIRLKGRSSNFFGNCLLAILRKKTEIQQTKEDFSGFDCIFVGSPVWAFAPTPQINTFLEKCKGLKGKSSSVFVTYGSGTGKDKALRIMKQKLWTKGVKEVHSFSVSDKITKDAGKLRETVKSVLESLPFSYKTNEGDNG